MVTNLRNLVFLVFMAIAGGSYAQYPPPAGQPGSTAIYKDSNVFLGWATGCTIHLGFVQMSDTTVAHNGSNKASYGFPEDALGIPDNFVVSLGDKGTATLTFENPVSDSTGPDFAVFENAFTDDFLELAFVEVSSDGSRFVRFPSVSLTQTTTQIPTFGTLDATRIHNLAGKYRLFYGVPFDLADLKDSLGINLKAVTHIRIVDAGGSLTPGYQSFDHQGTIINDPWPTPFFTCGFDLDAIGVIHSVMMATPESRVAPDIQLFPNPATEFLRIRSSEPVSVTLISTVGEELLGLEQITQATISLSAYPPGLYLVRLTASGGFQTIKRFVKV